MSLSEQLNSALGAGAFALRSAAGHAAPSGHLERAASRLEYLSSQVDQPCVVAVIGRMKAGKSSFINALLGTDLAKVGATETTATINHFVYGIHDPERPVRCHWRGGQVTFESREFLDSLQGADLETLRRAEGIDHLECRLPSPYLERCTLVDTPGVGAVVTEHTARTEEYLSLLGRLSDRHQREEERLGAEADAVIYLIGQVARATDRALLQEFARATGQRARASNALGVMAKIDLDPDLTERRHALAAKVAEQLQESLNTVLPVSSAIQQLLDQLGESHGEGLQHLIRTLRRIPPDRLSVLLDAEPFFLRREFEDCPVSPAERASLRGETPWPAFTLIARTAADPCLTPNEVVRQLEEVAGFRPLRRVLQHRFFERGHLLRAGRIIREARALLDELQYTRLSAWRAQDVQLRGFLGWVRQAPGDPAVRERLQEYLSSQATDPETLQRVQAAISQVLDQLDNLEAMVQEANADSEALLLIDEAPGLFSNAELDELRPLLGLYGLETAQRVPAARRTLESIVERAVAWQRPQADGRRQSVADRARTRYLLILAELRQAAAA